MNWKDARTTKPQSNSLDCYAVLFLYEGSVFNGFAVWEPKDGYTDGEWKHAECTNGNPLGGQVLYWHEFLARPAGVILWEHVPVKQMPLTR